MNILYISNNYPPYDNGGAEISTSLIANYVSTNNNCYILTGKFQNSPWKIGKTIVYPLLHDIKLQTNSFWQFFTYGLKIVFAPLFNTLIIAKFIKKNQIDLVHYVPTEYYYSSLVLAAIITKKPFIVDVRNYSLVCPSSLTSKNCAENHYTKHNHCLPSNYVTNNWLLQRFIPLIAYYEYCVFMFHTSIFRLVMRKSTRSKIVPNSEFVKHILLINGFAEEKMLVIKNIINEPIAESNITKKKQIAYAGQFDNAKGIWDLIHAFIELNNESFTLQLAGRGKELPAVKQYISKNNIKNIKLLGYLPNPEVQKMYRESYIVAAPSVWPEPFGRFILESISAEVPLVTTSVGGTPEGVVDRMTGMLVEASNPKALADAMRDLITDTDLYNKIVTNLRAEKAKYSAKIIGKQRIDLYELLIGNDEVKNGA